MKKICLFVLAVMILMLILPAGVLAAQMPEIDPKVEQAFKEAYMAVDDDYAPEELSLRYYGQYDGCHVAFVDGPFDFPSVEWSEVVAGYEFSYSSGQRLWVLRDKEIESLTGAYEAGWLSEDAVDQLYSDYSSAANPKTGDGISRPLAILMVSVLGLSALVWRKRI